MRLWQGTQFELCTCCDRTSLWRAYSGSLWAPIYTILPRHLKCLKTGIECARLPREAVFVALPRKVDTMLPRANLAPVEPNRSGSLSSGKWISVYCALSVETVWELRNDRTRLQRFIAGHEHGNQTNEFVAHEQLRATAAHNRYPALGFMQNKLYCFCGEGRIAVWATRPSQTPGDECVNID